MVLRLRSKSAAPAATVLPRKYDINEVVTLSLGDFLEHLPRPLVAAGNHDGSQALHFEIPKVAKIFIDGRKDIPLIEIYRQVPAVFAAEVKMTDTHRVAFPWSKLIGMLGEAHDITTEAGLTRAGALHLARLLRGFRGGPGVRPGAGGAVKAA